MIDATATVTNQRQTMTQLKHMRGRASLACLLILLSACSGTPSRDVVGAGKLLAAWSASQGRLAEPPPALDNSTVRVVVRPTIDGTTVRIKLENTIGTTPVTFAAAYIGVLEQGAALVRGSNQQLTFARQAGVTLQPGSGVYSDPINFPVRAFQRLAISLDVESASEISTHALGLTTTYYASGHAASSESGTGLVPVPPVAPNIPSFPVYWVAAVDVTSTAASGAIVAFGDSITDGACSTNDANGNVLPDLYQRWPDVLAERFASLPARSRKAIVNAGISGNRILAAGVSGPPALQRLDRDVLERAGTTHVIFFMGTNDISRGETSAAVIEGTRQIIDRVHARGMKIIGGTMIPRGSPEGAKPGFNELQERYRIEVNDWIRHHAPFDGVIDFDALMTGGGVSLTGAQIIKPEYSCDFIHPNAAGYRAIGAAIDLRLFE
jgi:lysophospholipase L1-like esterase